LKESADYGIIIELDRLRNAVYALMLIYVPCGDGCSFVPTETKAGCISQVKRKCGIEVGKNLRVATRRMDCLQGNSTTAVTDLELVPSPNLPKNEDSRQPQCPEDKESAIEEVLKHFKMNS
jgi:23S rRNA (uracil1939-C5)-methyltransferase